MRRIAPMTEANQRTRCKKAAKENHALPVCLDEVDAGCELRSSFFGLMRDVEAGCSSRQFDGEAQTDGYGF